MSEMTQKKMADWLERICKEDELVYDRTDDEDSIVFNLNWDPENTLGKVEARLIVEESRIVALGFIDTGAGKHKKEVTEYLFRVNDLLYTDHLWMNWDDGSIRHQEIWHFPSLEDDDDIRWLLFSPARRFRDYGDGLMKVILGCASPKDAYEEAEKALEEKRKETETED